MDPLTIRKVEFVKSSPRLRDIPGRDLPEFAFTGRSNVGKSSLINMLCNRTRVAKTSSTPGKTQLINHFLINGNWYLVDLPGYGYAKMPERERQRMTRMIREYILKSSRLVCLFLLIDSRLEMQTADYEFLQFLGRNGVPFAIVFTKTDKLRPVQLEKNIGAYKKKLLETWESLPGIFLSSSLHRSGREEILNFIQENLRKD
jgi:GTP-binding protein